jgi:hypothetical protein
LAAIAKETLIREAANIEFIDRSGEVKGFLFSLEY